MHIVIVDTTLTTPPTGGAHTFLVDIGQCLVARGDRVAVVTQPGPDESLVKALRIAGVEVYVDPWRNTHLPEERAQRLAQWVNERNPEVYVISASADVGWLALPQLSTNIATVSIAHNDSKSFYEPLFHYHSFIDIAVAVSAEIHRKILESGVAGERARQIAYGVEPVSKAEIEERLSRRTDQSTPLQIAYVGRIVQEQKRVMELVPFGVELKKRGVGFRLHLVGDGSERAHLSQAFAAQGVSDHVQFWGWQSIDKVKKILCQMDVFVLLSDYEGLPVALLEAMGHGLAPVVTRIASGNSEVITDGENGYLVEVGDIGGFADRVTRLSSDQCSLTNIQRAAWLTSQAYTISRMVDRYLKCFEDARSAGSSRDCRQVAAGAYAVMPSCVSRYPFWLRKFKYRFRGWASGVISSLNVAKLLR